MQTSGIHFPGLDVIRAFACLSVFTGHMFDYINNRVISNGAEAWLYERFVTGSGAMGVSLFFVLSGFLITFLLLREKKQRNTIHVGFFYMKRILRIWPLFMLITASGFFLIPAITSTYDGALTAQHLPWYLTFTNNFDRIATGFTGQGNDSLGVLWSVAVEEQFYLLWPLLLLITPVRFFPWLCTVIITVSAAFRFLFAANPDVLFYHSLSVSGDLAMGGLAAWLGIYSENFRKLFSGVRKGIRIVIALFVAVLIFNHQHFLQPGIFSVPGRIILCMAFAWLICDQSFGTTVIPGQTPRPAALTRIGVVSYGFYCFHMFVIMIIQKLNLALGAVQISALIFYAEFCAAFFLTWGVSELSYRFFERQFLRYRDRFDVFKRSVVTR